MALPQLNPFRFGDPVEGDYYLERPELTRTVAQFLENRIHIILIGPRRFGKTSFVLNLLSHLEKPDRSCLYVDIFNVTSHRDFLQQLVRGLNAQASWSRKLKKWVQSIPRLRPKFSWETNAVTGEANFSVSPSFSSDQDIKETIQDTLGVINRIDSRVVVAIDEFQTVTELEDMGWLEATLRTQMQHLKNTAFIFTGSRKSVINEMINNASRPFYRSCQPIEFPAFGEEFTDWIIERFNKVGVKCDRPEVNKLRKMVQDTPNYVQMACYHLVAQGTTKVDDNAIDEVLKNIVRQNLYAYQTLLNTLTPIQQRALRLAAIESDSIFSKNYLQKYEIPSGPALASVIKSLKQKRILDESAAKGRVIFDDPLFAIWLKKEFEY